MATGKATDLVIFATAKAKPGCEAAVRDALRKVAVPTRAQPGCVAFTLYCSADNPGIVTAVERWSSKAEHDRHVQGAHVAALMAAMDGRLTEPPSISAFAVADEI